MSRRPTTARNGASRRPPRPPGAWRRFCTALGALVVVLLGVPAVLVACARAGLDAAHPFPAIGSVEDVKAFFERDLTPTEIAPIAMRVLLIAGWLLWAAMAASVLSAILGARGSGLRMWLPQFAMFAGIGRWIAAGLTAVSTFAPNFVSAASLASPRPFTVGSITPERPLTVESPVAPGFARVRRGESIETFAQRTLGDAVRWQEIWEVNRGEQVGPSGEVWSAAWRLGAGWDLRLPAGGDRPAVPSAAEPAGEPVAEPIDVDPAAEPAVVGSYEVVEGDSFWGIAERFLPAGAADRDVWEFTQALMTNNAPRLGYAHPAMIHPGDTVDIVAPPRTAPAQVATADTASGVTDPAAHAVVAGDSYWEIAETVLGDEATPKEVLDLTADLIDLNNPRLGYEDRRLIHPGDVVYLEAPAAQATTTGAIARPANVDDDVDAIAIDELPTPLPNMASPNPTPASTTTSTSISTSTSTSTTTLAPPLAPEPPSVADDPGENRSPSSPIGIGQAALMATGIVALLAARRRAKLRAAEPPARVPLPSPEMVATERSLRSLDDAERLLRLDIALRVAADGLAETDHRIVVVRCAPDGTVEVRTPAPVVLDDPWVGSGCTWVLPNTIPIDELAAASRAAGAPCVALTQIGVDEFGWDVLVDVEATGLLAVDAESAAADAVLRAMAVGLASSEFAEVAHLIGVGLHEDSFLGHRHSHVVASVDEAVELAATLVGATAVGNRTTLSLRARHTSGEMWEPAVVIVAGSSASEVTPEVVSSAGRHSGMAIIVGAPVAGAEWTLRARGERWTLDPIGLRLEPVGIEAEQLGKLVETIDGGALEVDDVEVTAWAPVATTSNGQAVVLESTNGHRSPADFADVPWTLMVTLLGNVGVVDRESRVAKFERAKTVELVAWLVTHRQRANRTAARTALWDPDVRDATFANVVSEARRAMARHVAPPDGDEWLRRTLTEELSLHGEVVADVDLVQARFEAARRLEPAAALSVLRPAVELVEDLPFSGTGYLWPDAEGITSNFVLLATSVTAEHARLALAAGDIDGVFWSTGRGLKVLPGQEALIALRMRAHAESGDMSGVRCEWESYERVITADPWSDGEPAPKLVALRKELLSR